MEVVPFEPRFEQQVVELIVGIQRGEFDIPITAEQQPDLRRIPEYYQTGSGNFWARVEGRVVGTIALLDIGHGQAALRKMFVHPQQRGARTAPLGCSSTRCSTGRISKACARSSWERPRSSSPPTASTKHGFAEIPKQSLPNAFPVMEVDVKFYRLELPT
jgi:hypothetical protein